MTYLHQLSILAANLPRHMYLPAITMKSVNIIDNLTVTFVNVTIH